ncbi:dihydrofolate reductase [Halioglobus maricola]|uniref:Dihydrofolate reductase n=1 Tax=Halioglobus maricola TaxID=2601894 RepID=A0A5P9NLT0_9GAMM|nr:dihydrofolate reductase family protein [Halioglobus maricola]QFU76465.1 dihydrofolate reductase [Halioglobus maricola]
MKCSAYIAMSVDGFIATADGSVDWLDTAANPESGSRPAFEDGGFAHYLGSVDCMIMGRKCMEKIASFNLSPQQWPYGDMPIFAISRTVTEVPENLPDTVRIYSGDISALLATLEQNGHKHAYVDGGGTITSFLQQGLIDEVCVTQVPVLLGDGLPLFGPLREKIALFDAETTAYSNDFVQWKYKVSKS